MFKRIYDFFFGPHAICDDTPDGRKPKTQPVLTGMEFDSGEDMLKNG